VYLSGEDIAPIARTAPREPILCVLDALDGTQHWIRGRNMWCTAVSLFRQDDDGYELRVSAVQMPDGALYVAREDTREAFLDGDPTPLAADPAPVAMEQAHVCTVTRRPDQYRILAPLIAAGSPFGGLYSFGGNPILVELVLGSYNAIFQPDASSIGDAQELWDWLPGGHIAVRGGCTVLDLSGEPIDIPAAAAAAVRGESGGYAFVAAADPALAAATVTWLEDDLPLD
jgi:fructose-1,6-bisphosphatase/inositol monophosphatase family enzyme